MLDVQPKHCLLPGQASLQCQVVNYWCCSQLLMLVLKFRQYIQLYRFERICFKNIGVRRCTCRRSQFTTMYLQGWDTSAFPPAPTCHVLCNEVSCSALVPLLVASERRSSCNTRRTYALYAMSTQPCQPAALLVQMCLNLEYLWTMNSAALYPVVHSIQLRLHACNLCLITSWCCE